MEREETNNPKLTIQNIKLAEYVCPGPDIWIREEGRELMVSVNVAVNTMSVTLTQEGDHWVGGGVVFTCLGIPTGEEREREDEMYALMSNITDVFTWSKGVISSDYLKYLITFSAEDTLVLESGHKWAVFERGIFKKSK